MCQVSARPLEFTLAAFEQVLEENSSEGSLETFYFSNTHTAKDRIEDALVIFCGLSDADAGKAFLQVKAEQEYANENNGIVDLFEQMKDLILAPAPASEGGY